MPDQPESSESVKFSLTYSTDRDHFFRRCCPSCGRDFKMQVDEADLAAALQPAFRRMGLEVGEQPNEKADDRHPQLICCPYCEHCAESSDTLTATFSKYLERYIMREYILPQVNHLLGGFADSVGGNHSGSGGPITFGIRVEHQRTVMPPRPISGPEPPDMIIVELLCCGKKVKILDGWYGLSRCPYCGTRVTLC